MAGLLCAATDDDNERLRRAKRYMSLAQEEGLLVTPMKAECAARATLPWCGKGSQLSLHLVFLVQRGTRLEQTVEGVIRIPDERWGCELVLDERVRVLEVRNVEQAYRCCLELTIHSELCTVPQLPRPVHDSSMLPGLFFPNPPNRFFFPGNPLIYPLALDILHVGGATGRQSSATSGSQSDGD